MKTGTDLVPLIIRESRDLCGWVAPADRRSRVSQKNDAIQPFQMEAGLSLPGATWTLVVPPGKRAVIEHSSVVSELTVGTEL